MNLCPCNSSRDFAVCCAPYLNGTAVAQTPEALMRSRYTAYSLAAIDYIKKTMRGKPLIGFDEREVAQWARSVAWLGLSVQDSQLDNDHHGRVEFIASYLDGDRLKSIHEISEFEQIGGCWYYTDGKNPLDQQVKSQLIGRNALCPCGSNRKFKNCKMTNHVHRKTHMPD